MAADYKVNAEWTLGGSFTYRQGGRARVTRTLVNIAAQRREFDVYALHALSEATRLRLSANNVLQRELVTGARYVDADERLERRVARVFPVTFRVLLEHDF